MNLIPIPMEGNLLHTLTAPFCPDPSCGCHEDQTLIGDAATRREAGLLTPDEATNIVAGNGL